MTQNTYFIQKLTQKNTTQYSIIACMGERILKRMDLCICVTDLLDYTHKTNTTL